MNNWKIFRGDVDPHDGIDELPPPPPWRLFSSKSVAPGGKSPGETFQCKPEVVEIVNAALHLRRPLLLTGKPGTGKSSLIYRVAYELQLGDVLEWSVTSKTSLQSGLYQYDAIGRFQAYQLEKRRKPDIGKYLKLGPLGTAFMPLPNNEKPRPRALLIDEIDKGDLDFPNELLNIFEKGEFRIAELERMAEEETEIRGVDGSGPFVIRKGHVQCEEFPFVVLTSNEERDFPPAFLRRCLQFTMKEPDETLLTDIVRTHLGEEVLEKATPLIKAFLGARNEKELATDQLLNTLHLVIGKHEINDEEKERLKEVLWNALNTR